MAVTVSSVFCGGLREGFPTAGRGGRGVPPDPLRRDASTMPECQIKVELTGPFFFLSQEIGSAALSSGDRKPELPEREKKCPPNKC